MTPQTIMQDFRTEKDHERARRAAEVHAGKLADVDAALRAVTEAEAVCVASPNDKAFEKASAARRVLEEAERVSALANAHVEAVEAESVVAEHAAIRVEIEKRVASLTDVVDDAARLDAVDAAARGARLYRRTIDRVSTRRAELEAINALRARVGEPPEEVPTAERLMLAASVELGDLGLVTQRRLGFPAQAVRETFARFFPFWREGRVDWEPREEGRRHGDRERLDAEVAELLARLEQTRASGVTAKVAVVALAALSMVGG
ncbi:MAG: hypothetical protein KF894_26950 [Labilithrix sp.]|nr:hypothetical protein [Labilithrix sp.]